MLFVSKVTLFRTFFSNGEHSISLKSKVDNVPSLTLSAQVKCTILYTITIIHIGCKNGRQRKNYGKIELWIALQ